ncbi:2-amino-4-hydroxy-6-hydroxymethyldihydropteridine diphosphokinase [Planctomyces sp. SH-PL14]|uniref:2-amino-4-hydroxy-6- hydroxymethyldihydropteridine diphosphokinase n=1 Tax=Planctomyces sp. SH-PL14 TaxID=1632864 RepID=UPI00078CD12F|nr:2-amino-4-hydroxy-6-hydroxymethyldihydropteridine diphosphokinase [Planctomyces sp. SH-PL14]AMV17154.1 2-amino-4-hydroxy-6-hydroxymethyldihydropteridine pyrophosphokinase [Planctomyces sp. SH-PL14]
MQTLYHLGFGGNLGDVAATMRRALTLLDESAGTVVAASSLYHTAPMGTEAGTGYQNAVVALSSDWSPPALLAITQQIERECGRERLIHWGPRTLDIDLLLAGPTVIQAPTLTIPHPGLAYRRFALDPLVEIAPTARHPLWNLPVREIQAALRQRPLPVAVRTESPFGRRALLEQWPESLRRQIALAPADHGPDRAGRWVIDLTSSVPNTTPFHLTLEGMTSLERLEEILSAMLDEPQVIGALAPA